LNVQLDSFSEFLFCLVDFRLNLFLLIIQFIASKTHNFFTLARFHRFLYGFALKFPQRQSTFRTFNQLMLFLILFQGLVLLGIGFVHVLDAFEKFFLLGEREVLFRTNLLGFID